MCLHSIKGKPSIAKRDIVCYKVLQQHQCNFNPNHTYIVTPFQHCEIVDTQLNGSSPIKAKFYPITSVPYQNNSRLLYSWDVGEGYIHTYRSKRAAKKAIFAYSLDSDLLNPNWNEQNWVTYGVIYECIIPKGTKYYKGIDDADIRCYASEEIRVKALIVK